MTHVRPVCWPWHASAAFACVLSASCGREPARFEPVEALPELARLTAEQYRSTVRDLFAPVVLRDLHFPPELRVDGFENNVGVNAPSTELVSAWYDAARQIAADVIDQRAVATGCPAGDISCHRTWLRGLLDRAYRRPLSSAEADATLAQLDTWTAASGLENALRLSLEELLCSPDFLYFREDGGDADTDDGWVALTSWQMATRLSYFIWGTMPDSALFERARRDDLRLPQSIEAEARRMLADPKAVEGLWTFYRQLLNVDRTGAHAVDYAAHADHFGGIADPRTYVHESIQPAMQAETKLFVTSELFDGDASLRSLLTSRRTWVTEALAKVYGVSLPASGRTREVEDSLSRQFPRRFRATFHEVQLPEHERAGLLTMPGVLHARSKEAWPSPTNRGIFMQEVFIACESPPPAIGDVVTQGDPFTPGLFDCPDPNKKPPKSNRERYASHTDHPECAACHYAIDYTGLAFEKYDALGGYRTHYAGAPIDSSGELIGTELDRPVGDALELIGALAQSRTAHDCHAKQWYRYAFGRYWPEQDADALRGLQDAFWATEGRIPELVVTIATSHHFRHRRASL